MKIGVKNMATTNLSKLLLEISSKSNFMLQKPQKLDVVKNEIPKNAIPFLESETKLLMVQKNARSLIPRRSCSSLRAIAQQFLSSHAPIKSKRECCDNAARHCYHKECETAINEQILSELNAAYAYLSMACYFGRSEVALPGCHGYFSKMHEEEMGHARKLINYQNMRGGRVKLFPITCTECTEWNVAKALEVGLEMEKLVKEKLTEVHDIAEKHHDLQMMDMIVTEFLNEQNRSICEFGRLLARFNSMRSCGPCGCVEFEFDKEMHKTFIRKAENKNEIPLEMVYK